MFIDIHCHIIPGVDDGAADMRSALQMLHMAWEDGIQTMILTPHYRGRYRDISPEKIRIRFGLLQERCAETVPDMKLYLGCEAMYETALANKLAAGEVLTMADSDYVLLENLPSVSEVTLRRSVDELIQGGYWPIIAHVERYECVHKKPDLAANLVEMGAYLQVNASSMLKERGILSGRFCTGLLEQGLISFIASDAHDLGNRRPELRKCAELVQKKAGIEAAREIFINNPTRILNHRTI